MTHRSGPEGTNTGKGMSLGSCVAGPFPAPLPHHGLSPPCYIERGKEGCRLPEAGKNS